MSLECAENESEEEDEEKSKSKHCPVIQVNTAVFGL